MVSKELEKEIILLEKRRADLTEQKRLDLAIEELDESRLRNEYEQMSDEILADIWERSNDYE